jgi:hypothetical protein
MDFKYSMHFQFHISDYDRESVKCFDKMGKKNLKNYQLTQVRGLPSCGCHISSICRAAFPWRAAASTACFCNICIVLFGSAGLRG